MDFKSNTELRIQSKDLAPLVKSEITRLEEEKTLLEKEIEKRQKDLDDINERIDHYKLFLQSNGKEKK